MKKHKLIITFWFEYGWGWEAELGWGTWVSSMNTYTRKADAIRGAKRALKRLGIEIGTIKIRIEN